MAGDNLKLSIRFKAETAELKRELAATKAALDAFRRESSLLSRQLGATAGKSTLAAQGLERIGDQSRRALEEIAAQTRNTEKLNRTLSSSGDALERTKRNTEQTTKATHRLSEKIRQLNTRFANLKNLVAAGIFGLVTREIWQAGVQMDRFRIIMGSAVNDLQLSAREMAFVRREADRMGQAIEPAILGYARLRAAVIGTPLENQSREIFQGISQTIRAFRMSTDDADGVWRAFIQILSKGKVQAEELRGQLGERIPGAFRIAAEAIGVTQERLNAMMDRGEVYAEDFIPKFIARLSELTKTGAELSRTSPDAALNRLSNAFFALKAAIANSGIIDLMASIVEGLTQMTEAATNFFSMAKRQQSPRGRGYAGRRESNGAGLIDRGPQTAEEARARLARLDAEFKDQAEQIQRRMEQIERLAGRNRSRLEIERKRLLVEQYRLVAAAEKLNEAYLAFENITGERPDKPTFKSPDQKQIDALKEYIAELNAQRLALGLNAEQAILYEAAQRLAAEGNQEMAGQVWEAAEALAAETKAINEAKAAQSLFNDLMREDQAQDRYQRNLNLLAKLHRSGRIDADEYQRAIDRLTERYLELSDTSEQAAASQQQAAGRARRIAQIYKTAAEGIYNAFATTFEDILENGAKGFERFGERVLSVFRAMLARMAALAIARPVIVPVVTALGGILGIGQEAMAGVLDELGGAQGAGLNPALGFGVLAGGMLIGSLIKRRRERRRREREAAEALSVIDDELKKLAGTSTATADRLRAANRAIAAAASPVELTKALIERYRIEKQMLTEIVKIIDGIAERAGELLKKLGEDKRKIQGLPDYRSLDTIRRDVRNTARALRIPDQTAYLEIKNAVDERVAKLNDQLTELQREAARALEEERQDYDAYSGKTQFEYGAEIRALRRQIAAENDRAADALGRFMDELENWAKTAEDGIQRLDELRAETLRYYEAQKRLAEGLSRSVQTIDAVLARFADEQRIPTERVRAGIDRWRSQLELAKTLSGSELVTAIDQLTSGASTILAQAREVYASGIEYSSLYGEIRAGLEQIRSRAESQAEAAAEQAAAAEQILTDIEQALTDMSGALKNMSTDIVNAIESQRTELADELRAIQQLLGGDETVQFEAMQRMPRPGRNTRGDVYGNEQPIR